VLPFLIYLNTLVYIPHYVFIITILYAVYKKSRFTKADFSNYLLFTIIIIVFLSTINFAAHYLLGYHREELIPYTFLMIGSYLIAISLSPGDLKVLIYITLVECFIGYVEFLLGVKTFFTGIENYSEVDSSTGLLYFRSVYGLSNNSSALADKIFLAYLLSYWLGLKGKKILVVRLIFLGGIVIAFNRTSMLAIAFFHVIQYAPVIFKSFAQFLRLRINKRLFYSLLAGVSLFVVGLYLALVNLDVLVDQLTRKTQTVELSGRDVIWGEFFAFIKEHLLLGNGSFKYYVGYGGGLAHAHNSFIQVLATHGIIIFVFHILLIILNLNRSNLIYVASLVVFSTTQYGIFWGISLTDIVLMVFLLSRTSSVLTIGRPATVLNE